MKAIIGHVQKFTMEETDATSVFKNFIWMNQRNNLILAESVHELRKR